MMGPREFHFDKEEEHAFEAEETLSLSDLPLTGDSAQWDCSYSKEDDDDDFFEFISEDFAASTIEREIIFCGKIISPYKESSKDARQSNTLNQNDNDSSILLPWVPNKHTSRTTISRNSTLHNGQELKDSRNLIDNYSRGRVSLMRSATKSKWYLFTFRMPSTRLPAEMELRDIRNRQRRRNVPATTKLPEPEGGDAMASKNKGRRIWWFGKMLRSLGLGCGNNTKQANDVVKSFMSMM